MKIDNIYIGGWFQRTTLQLSEIYDFLRDGTSFLELNQKKLTSLHKALDLNTIQYGLEGLECVSVTTNDDVSFKIFEDGLIVLNSANTSKENLFYDIDALANYYETKLSPAINYLFSLGAPVPKELANIKTVYPYFIVLKNASKEEMQELLNLTEKQKYFEINNDNYDILRGDTYYFINNKKKTENQIEKYIEEQIFIREFKAQLHHYLNLHRSIWEKIADVKENSNISGKEIMKFSAKVELYAKTVNLVGARINQMSTYLHTREKIAKNDKDLGEFLNILGYRYETLGDTLIYIQHLWSMTKNYVNSAAALFDGLRQDITSKSVDNLTIVTSMGVGASLIGLFTTTKAPTFTIFGIGYFIALALLGYIVNKTMKHISEKRKYHISDDDYDKNIK